jgi:hypothetical protein
MEFRLSGTNCSLSLQLSCFNNNSVKQKEEAELKEAIRLSKVEKVSKETFELTQAISLSKEETDKTTLKNVKDVSKVETISKEEFELNNVIELSKKEQHEATIKNVETVSQEEFDLNNAIILSKEEADQRQAETASAKQFLVDKVWELFFDNIGVGGNADAQNELGSEEEEEEETSLERNKKALNNNSNTTSSSSTSTSHTSVSIPTSNDAPVAEPTVFEQEDRADVQLVTEEVEGAPERPEREEMTVGTRDFQNRERMAELRKQRWVPVRIGTISADGRDVPSYLMNGGRFVLRKNI